MTNTDTAVVRNKSLAAFLALISCLILSLGCTVPDRQSPNLGKSYKLGFSSQIINHDAPYDRSPVDTLPGDIANQIYHKKYIPSLTEKKENKDSASQELGDMD